MTRRPILVAAALCALPLAASPGSVPTLSSVDAAAAEALLDEPSSRLRAEDAARALVQSDAWAAVDPSLQAASTVDVEAFRFGARQVVRLRPFLGGIPVEGADRKLVFTDGTLADVYLGAPLARAGSHQLGLAQATAAAIQAVDEALFIDPTVERTGGLGYPVWLARGEQLRAAYRVRVPTLSIRSLRDVWVDGETGEIIKTRLAAYFVDGGVDGGVLDGGPLDGGAPPVDAGEPVDAGGDGDDDPDAGGDGDGDGDAPPAPTASEIFQWWPGPTIDEEDLVPYDLPDLADAYVGDPLVGKHIATYNCCKQHVCKGGQAECDMNDPAEARCATPEDEDPVTSEISVVIPGEVLPPQIPVEELYAKTVFCAELPRARSQPAEGGQPAGWFENPVDAPYESSEALGLASDEDAFAEVQAYAVAATYFQHIRDTLEDPAWCLGGDSMPCDDNGDLLDEDDEGNPVEPFHLTVNALRPEIDLEEVVVQVLNGQGATPGNPILLEDYAREDVAVFLPALSSGLPGLDIPEELSVLADIFTREFDSIVLFQGTARDFGYDGSLVAHEFGHAAIYNMVPDLEIYTRDEWGANAAPGAVQEALADYLAASFTGDPVISPYASASSTGGEIGVRNLSQSKACPEDTAGDQWDDSLPLSTALWALRDRVITAQGEEAVADLDRALWSVIPLLSPEEKLPSAADKIVSAITDELGNAMGTAVAEELDARNVRDCERTYDLAVLDGGQIITRNKVRMVAPTPDQIGTTTMAPTAVQFRVQIPAGSSGFSLQWTQRPQLTAEFSTADAVALSVLTHLGPGPVEWVYTGANSATAQPRDAGGSDITFNPEIDANRADMSNPEQPTYSRELAPACFDRTAWVQLVNVEDSVPVLGDIQVAVAPGMEVECDGEDGGTGGDGDGDSDGGPEMPPGPCGCDLTSGDADAGGPVAGLALLGVLAWRRRRARR